MEKVITRQALIVGNYAWVASRFARLNKVTRGIMDATLNKNSIFKKSICCEN